MKTLISIVFIASLFWQSLYQTAYIVYWKSNRANIIKTECINRFKPMMHCNGKCQLYRQLKKAAEEEAENNKLPMAVLKLKTPDAFILEYPTWHWNVFLETQTQVYSDYTAIKERPGYYGTPYKPPQLPYIL